MWVEYDEALNRSLVQNNKQIIAALQEFRKVGAGLVAQFTQETRINFGLRPDDPIRYDEDGSSTLIVWSDFECSHCRAFGDRFENGRSSMPAQYASAH